VKLNREQILKTKDLKTQEVDVAEWGGSIIVKELSTRERLEFNDFVAELKKDNEEITPLTSLLAMNKLVILSVVDEFGDRIFMESDIDALSEKSTIILTNIATVAMKLNGMNDQVVAEVQSKLKNPPADSYSG
jgi:hypothetical protein